MATAFLDSIATEHCEADLFMFDERIGARFVNAGILTIQSVDHAPRPEAAGRVQFHAII